MKELLRVYRSADGSLDVELRERSGDPALEEQLCNTVARAIIRTLDGEGADAEFDFRTAPDLEKP
jgi:hypothetical protein